MDTNGFLLEIKNFGLSLTADEGEKVLLENIDLAIPQGGFVTLTGKSGCGKTVLARSIAGLYPSRQSQIRGNQLFQATVLDNSLRKKIMGKDIAMVFQQPAQSFDPVMRLGNQLVETWHQHRQGSTALARTQIREWLSHFNFGDLDRILKAYPHQLSGGQLQRLSLAAATLHSPKLLIADEATSALDAENEKDIIDLIQEMRKSTGMAVLWISHDLPAALPISDHIYVMDQGKITASAVAAHFQTHASDPASKELLAAVYHPSWKRSEQIEPLVSLNNITKKFDDKTIFENFNLRLCRGQRLAIAGPSGCGKSTLARIIAGVEDVQGGDAVWQDQSIKASSRVQLIFQHPALSLNPKMTIAQSLSEPFRIHKQPFNHSILTEKLSEVQLTEEMLDRYPHQLSGGQLQRVCIARSLVLLPQLLILDEAVTALDAVNKVQILYLLDQMHQKYNMAMLMITHDQQLAHLFCDEVITLSDIHNDI
ncbi:MAG: ABC transporter ATP-binding protein [Saprospiraceae bacterium]|nr:ABC transporter ATP-binding protein [Saprospiraceae bacterium]